MKRKFTLLIAALALLTMIVQPGRVWGQTSVTFTAGVDTGETFVTKNGITVSMSTMSRTDNYRTYANSDMTVSSTVGNIQSVVVTCTANGTSNYGPGKFSVPANSSGSYTYESNGHNGTWTGASDEMALTASTQVRMTQIVVTYDDGGSTLEDNDIALTGAPVALSFDLYNNSSAQVINYTTSSSGTVTIANNSYIETEVDQVNKTITVTPSVVTNGEKTITINQAADDNYYAGSTTFTVNITNSAPSTGGDVTFNATEDKGTSPLVKNGVTFACSNGVLNNGSEYRLYKNSVTTFSVSEGTITQIVFTCTSGNPASGFATQTGWTTNGTNGTWTGSATSVSFTASGAQVRATQIVVTVATPTTDPSINASDVNIAYNAQGGNIEFTIVNPDDDATLAAEVVEDATISNFTLGNVGESTIAFTCDANTETTARTATVTLNYVKNTEVLATKDVTITQAAAPVVYSTIPELFDAAAATAKSVEVDFNNWVVSGVSTNGKNVFVTDNNGNGFVIYDNSGNLGTTYSAGDILSGNAVSCDLVLFNGFAELTNVDATDLTITSGGTVTVANVPIADLAGVNTGALLHYDNLTCSVNSNKYYLSDGTTTLQVYNALYAFDALENGKKYNITGVYQQYNSTKEILPRSADDIEEATVIVPTIIISDDIVDVPAEGGEGTLTVSYDNITEIAAEVWFCNAEGTEDATYDWITASINANNNVEYLVEPNDGEARTAYFEVWAYDDDMNEVYSNLVTINQEEYVAPTYATLPFSFDGGRAAIATTDGLYQEGLGSDYNNSPKLKFDGTGDWLLLQFQERPGTLTFDIKGNSYSSGSTSTFKVQTSADGTTYTDLVTYTELGDTQNESFDNLDENVRYIKWIYTEKGATSGGNVGLGNISLAEYVEPVASITVTPNLVEATIEETEGYLGITYVALDITQADDFGIQFYDVNNQELNGDDEPDWIQAAPATQSGEEGYFVYYIIEENSGAERTAYFKVWALEDTEPVYSNLVTISQAAPVVLPPVINAEDIEIEFDATSGEIAYTITNPTTATLSANSTDEWITDITIEAEKVSFSTTVNEGDTDRIGTITLSYEGAEDKVVTVTQGHQVVDYAILPFEWEGGTTAAFNALTGASTYGVGDYAESHGVYRMKLDSDGDYIQVKTDSQPGKVTIGVKMIGGVNTSYITVKASTDGQEFDDGEALEISGTSGSILTLETTRSFDADVRFVKMVFAKGSNVGVGPITITKFTTDPVIVAEDKEIACDATAGEIVYSITNPVDGGVLTANTTAEWLTIGTVGETVPFTCEANTEATAREATVTLTYTYGDSQTVTKDVTVTQAAYIIDYAEMPFDFDGGRADIENTNGLTQSGLDTDYGSSPKLKFKNQGTTVTLKLNAAPVSLSYDIKGNSFSGGQFDVEYSADGETYTNLVSYTELGNTQYVLHTDFDSNVRYIRWIYTTKVNGNVALGNIHATEHYDTYGDVTFNDLDLTATSESLIVHTGSVVTITGTLTNTSSDNLIIEDGGQLVFSSTDVQATVKKRTVGEAKDDMHWYTIASPVANKAFTEVTNLVTASAYDLYRYNEGEYKWENYKSTEPVHSGFNTGDITSAFEAGRGYLYYNADGSELSFAGTLNNDEVSCNVTASHNGINLIGNPFTQNITLDNIEGTISAGGYVLNNANDWSADPNPTIQPCEGFIVEVADEQNITIQKTPSSKSRANRDYIALTVANSEYEDVTYALFSDGMGLSKINHRNADIPMVYIPQNGQNYAIATMDDNTQAFELNFKAMTTGQYTLSYKAEGKYSYLHVIDRLTGEDIDMLLDGEYSFIGSPRDNEARFIVKLSYNANIDEIEVNDIFAYQNGSDIIVNGNGELQVFDVTGRMVMNTKINGIQTVNVPATGMYIFRMVGESVQTQKIVVR